MIYKYLNYFLKNVFWYLNSLIFLLNYWLSSNESEMKHKYVTKYPKVLKKSSEFGGIAPKLKEEITLILLRVVYVIYVIKLYFAFKT